MKIQIKNLVEEILLEEEDSEKPKPKPKPKKQKKGIEASTGSGAFSAGVKEAGALAKDNPKQLMKNLNVSNASGNGDLEKVKSIFKQAFTGTDAMKKVYVGLSEVQKAGKTGLRVKVDVIKVRDAIKYLYHTLVGAENSGIFSPDSLIQIENDSGSVVVYQGNKRTWPG